MNKLNYLLIISLWLGAWTPLALADLTPTPAVDVIAEYFPGQKYVLGLELDSNHNLQRVYFQNNDGSKNWYNLADLINRVVLMSTQSGKITYNLVFLSMQTVRPGFQYDFTLSYMRNGLIKNATSKTYYSLKYNQSSNRFEVYDLQSNRIIYQANVTTNRWLGKAVGIDRIYTN